MLSINQKLFLLINSFAGKNEILDKIVLFLGEGGPYIFIILIALIYFIKKEKKGAIYGTIAVIVAILLNHGVEHFYFHNRPFVDGLGSLLKEHRPDSSFPSDHTTFMVTLSWGIAIFANRKLGLKMLGVATLFGLCRVVEGVHYPFDILGAIGMGLFAVILVKGLERVFKPLVDMILNLDKKIFKN